MRRRGFLKAMVAAVVGAIGLGRSVSGPIVSGNPRIYPPDPDRGWTREEIEYLCRERKAAGYFVNCNNGSMRFIKINPL